MPPIPKIPVYDNAPLHPEGVTPQTAPPEEQPEPTRTTNPATTTTSNYDSSGPPPPQPGARPQLPVQTGTSSFCDPPAPQPGDPVGHHGHHIPAITAVHTTTTTSQQPTTPSQFSIPAPSSNYAPTHTTSTSSQPQTRYSPQAQLSYQPQPSPFETGNDRRASLEHPPGYAQNPFAADGTADDRVRFSDAAKHANEEEGVFRTVKSYLGGAGEALKKAEEEAWRLAKGLGGEK